MPKPRALERRLTAHDVFTPGAFPEHTYVARADEDLEQKLRFALKTKGQIVSLSGPSKAGKTVLVEKVVGKDSLVPIVGAGVRDPAQIWTRALDWLDVPLEREGKASSALMTGARAGAKASGNVVVASGEASGFLETGVTKETAATEKTVRRGLEQVVEELAGTDLVVMVDDFHYMPRDVQVEVAKELKEAARREVRIVTAAVPHRADDVVRANPELRGRVTAIDVPYWDAADLVRIAEAGFSALNVEISPASAERLARESAGSPQLMQALCLYACFVLGATERLPARTAKTLTAEDHTKVCKLTSTVCDFRSLVDVLDAGPRTRGAERRTYTFSDGSAGDVYRVVLRAVAAEPLSLSFSYDELIERVRSVCRGDAPPGSSVVGTVTHMQKLAIDQLPTHRVLDWDEDAQVLHIPDPYFLFYLRWSDRLREAP